MFSKIRIRTAVIMIRIALHLLLQFTPYNCSTTASCIRPGYQPIQWQKCTYFCQKSTYSRRLSRLASRSRVSTQSVSRLTTIQSTKSVDHTLQRLTPGSPRGLPQVPYCIRYAPSLNPISAPEGRRLVHLAKLASCLAVEACLSRRLNYIFRTACSPTSLRYCAVSPLPPPHTALSRLRGRQISVWIGKAAPASAVRDLSLIHI